jgi:hypothetical protein
MPTPLPNEFDDNLFVFLQYGNALSRPIPAFAINRTNLQLFQGNHDMDEFVKGFRIGGDVHPSIVAQLSAVIQHCWDCFYKDRARNSILGFEFAIDTGALAPVCCPKPCYGPHESTIIQKSR